MKLLIKNQAKSYGIIIQSTPLPLFRYVNQTIKRNLCKTCYQIRNTEFPNQKANVLPPRYLFSSLIIKLVILALNLDARR